jgi:hypothetical protein
MKKHTGLLATGIIGLIVIAFTIIAFFLLNIERNAIQRTGLIFLLLSQIVLFIGLIVIRFLKKNSVVFIGSALSVTLVIYFFVTLSTVVLTGKFIQNFNTFVLLQIFIVAQLSVVIVIIFTVGHKIAKTDNNTLKKMTFMNDYERRIFALLSNSQNTKYKQQLNTIYEDTKYADKVGSSSLDNELSIAIDKLERLLDNTDSKDEEILALFDKLNSFLKRRSLEISQSKRGGF